MADLKISQLGAISILTPATDVLPVVDSGGVTKKITTNQILGSGGTATLASATITGDLTVDTSTLKVDSANNRVGIGTATPGVRVDILSDNNTSLAAVLRVNSNNAAVNTALAYDGLIASGGMTLQAGTSNPIIFNTNGANESGRINTTGVYVLKGGTTTANGVGVAFPATQVASSDANTLDDYEEGTWTIGLTFGGGSTGITTAANTGRYTKIGRQVTVIGYLSLTSKGSSTGSASITDLPFAIPNTSQAFCAASLRIDGLSYVGSPQALGLIGSSKIELEKVSEAGTATALTDANFSNSTGIIFTLTYTV